jgi:hypothetical protein
MFSSLSILAKQYAGNISVSETKELVQLLLALVEKGIAIKYRHDPMSTENDAFNSVYVPDSSGDTETVFCFGPLVCREAGLKTNRAICQYLVRKMVEDTELRGTGALYLKVDQSIYSLKKSSVAAVEFLPSKFQNPRPMFVAPSDTVAQIIQELDYFNAAKKKLSADKGFDFSSIDGMLVCALSLDGTTRLTDDASTAEQVGIAFINDEGVVESKFISFWMLLLMMMLLLVSHPTMLK